MKKFLTAAIALMFLLGSSSQVFAEESFTPFVDIEDHWAKESIEILYLAQLVRGVDENHFAPNQKLTRAEFAALLVRTLELEDDGSKTASFKDVPKGKWYSKAIIIAHQNGIMNGYKNNMFKPNNNISREEMAVIFVRLMLAMDIAPEFSEWKQNEIVSRFSDGSQISWSKKSVSQIVATEVMSGRENQRFAPKAASTRAETAVIVLRFLEYVNLFSEDEVVEYTE